MGFSGRPNVRGFAIFEASSGSFLIVLDNTATPNPTYIHVGHYVWVNGVALRVTTVDGVCFRVSTDEFRATNGTGLFRAADDDDDPDERIRVMIEYASRSSRFTGPPHAVASVAVRPSDDDDTMAELLFAAHTEPADRRARVLALNGVAYDARRTDFRDSDGDLWRVMRVSFEALKGTALENPGTVRDVNFSFATVEDVAEPGDFETLVRSESDALDLALSEARIAAYEYWGRRGRKLYPVGGVLLDRHSGFVHARFHCVDGGIFAVADAWLSARKRLGPSSDLALYVTAPAPDDTDEVGARLSLLGVKHFFYGIAPWPSIACCDAYAPVGLDPSAPVFARLDRFYRAFVYRQQNRGLPYVTFARMLDITPGLPASFERQIMLPDSTFEFEIRRNMIDHLRECAQVTLVCKADGMLAMEWTERVPGPVQVMSARGRDQSREGTVELPAEEETAGPVNVLVAAPKSREESERFLRELGVTHLVLADPDGNALWPRQCVLWELVREQALFCVPSSETRRNSETVFLSEFGARGDGFLYMTALRNPGTTTDTDDALAKADHEAVLEDASPLAIRILGDGSAWVVLTISATTAEKLWTVFTHLSARGAVPSLYSLDSQPCLLLEDVPAAVAPDKALRDMVTKHLSPVANPGTDEKPVAPFYALVVRVVWASFAAFEAPAPVLVAPLAREHVTQLVSLSQAYGIQIVEKN